MMQIVAVTALGLFVSWLFHQWLGLFDNFYLGAGVWIGVCILYGIIYDRRQSRLRPEVPATTGAGRDTESSN